MPKRANYNDAGLDLCSVENIILKSGEVKAVDTGLQVSVPDGYELQIRPRSGLALKNITVLNTPGTIDSGFRGNVKVIIKNFSSEDFKIEIGNRIAQMIINKIELWDPIEVTELSKTNRGSNGFGSTGV